MLKKLDQAFSKVEGFLSVVLFLAMVAIVCWSVICRYALKIPFLQSEELARYLMIYIVYIGTSIGVKVRATSVWKYSWICFRKRSIKRSGSLRRSYAC